VSIVTSETCPSRYFGFQRFYICSFEMVVGVGIIKFSNDSCASFRSSIIAPVFFGKLLGLEKKISRLFLWLKRLSIFLSGG
ncbi:hypothetical protein, partial [Pseudomonas sp. ITEM 17296]|uniref:hypothetical protein n=1 Tax=Pseudomonas sp. ITEM 17296 TaxID=2790281 RepID=UPI0023808B5D